MSYSLSNFEEWSGFSQIIIFESRSILRALKEMSPKFPIGVATRYKPLFNKFFIFFIMRNSILLVFLSLFLYSCIPQGIDNKVGQKAIEENNSEKTYISEASSDDIKNNNIEITEREINEKTYQSNRTIEIVLPSGEKYKYISDSFLNALEIAIFD